MYEIGSKKHLIMLQSAGIPLLIGYSKSPWTDCPASVTIRHGKSSFMLDIRIQSAQFLIGGSAVQSMNGAVIQAFVTVFYT